VSLTGRGINSSLAHGAARHAGGVHRGLDPAARRLRAGPVRGGDPFAGRDEEAGIAAFGGLILGAGPGLCALNIDRYVSALDPPEQDVARAYIQRTQRPQGIAALRQQWQGGLRTTGSTYILTTADTLVPPDAQRNMAASISGEVVEIDTDHGPFREQPGRLAEPVTAAAR
jgi:hypothetical protein